MVFQRRTYNYANQTTSKLRFDDAALKNKFTKIHTFKFNPDSMILMAGTVDSTHAFIAITDTLDEMYDGAENMLDWTQKNLDSLFLMRPCYLIVHF